VPGPLWTSRRKTAVEPIFSPLHGFVGCSRWGGGLLDGRGTVRFHLYSHSHLPEYLAGGSPRGSGYRSGQRGGLAGGDSVASPAEDTLSSPIGMPRYYWSILDLWSILLRVADLPGRFGESKSQQRTSALRREIGERRHAEDRLTKSMTSCPRVGNGWSRPWPTSSNPTLSSRPRSGSLSKRRSWKPSAAWLPAWPMRSRIRS